MLGNNDAAIGKAAAVDLIKKSGIFLQQYQPKSNLSFNCSAGC